MAPTVHIVGAGLAGLAAAVKLAGKGMRAAIYEASASAGGRCRSHEDRELGLVDNGNHLLLSGNRAALDYLATIGARERLRRPESAIFPFVDVASGERWRIDLGEGRLPLWLFDSARRVPHTRASQYLPLMRLLRGEPDRPLGEKMACSGPVYERLLKPLLTAAMNADPAESSTVLIAALFRESIAAGGRACLPLIAKTGLSDTFIDPALAYLQARGGATQYNRLLREIVFDGDRCTALKFNTATVELAPEDRVILAVTPTSAAPLIPGLKVPDDFRPILNLHYRDDGAAARPAITGVVGGLTEWIFAYPGRISVTISNAVRLMDSPREELAQTVWNEICRALELGAGQPAWKLVRERRATFAATPAQQALRPGAQTRWRNLFLAGDWTDTGLPATIEGAIRSGNRAAALASA